MLAHPTRVLRALGTLVFYHRQHGQDARLANIDIQTSQLTCLPTGIEAKLSNSVCNISIVRIELMLTNERDEALEGRYRFVSDSFDLAKNERQLLKSALTNLVKKLSKDVLDVNSRLENALKLIFLLSFFIFNEKKRKEEEERKKERKRRKTSLVLINVSYVKLH